MRYLQFLVFTVLLLQSCSKDKSENLDPDDTYKNIEKEVIDVDLTASILKIVIPNKIERFKKEGDNPDKPLLFSDFEKIDADAEPSIGDLIAGNFSPWEDRGPKDHPSGIGNQALVSDVTRIDDESNKRSLTMRFYKDENGKTDPTAWVNNLDFAATGKVFVSYWVKYKWPETQPSKEYQYKTFAIYSRVSGAHGKIPNFSMFNWMWLEKDLVTPYTSTMIRAVSGAEKPASTPFYFHRNSMPTQTDDWYHFVFLIDQGSPEKVGDAVDGRYWMWMSDPQVGVYRRKGGLDNGESFKFLSDEMPANQQSFGAIKLAWYIKIFDQGWDVDIYYDDFVADNTWAQVYLGDKATFEESTILEIQAINAWDFDSYQNTIINADLKLGQLAGKKQLYVYVFNEDGVCNTNGYVLNIE